MACSDEEEKEKGKEKFNLKVSVSKTITSHDHDDIPSYINLQTTLATQSLLFVSDKYKYPAPRVCATLSMKTV